LDPGTLVKYVAQYPLTDFLTMPPTIRYIDALNYPEIWKGFASLRRFYFLGEPMGPRLQGEFRKKLHAAGRANSQDYDCRVIQAWGMTEILGVSGLLKLV
jgi:acyl-coenzyme A synthetase/AMP-(fatty) acid ligase